MVGWLVVGLWIIVSSSEVFGDRVQYEKCGYTIFPSWSTTLGGGIVQTPQITDFYADDMREIVVPTYKRFVEVVSGEDGGEVDGWPFSHPSFSSVSATISFDITKDGENEIIVSTFDGTILFFTQRGELLHEYTIQVIPLKVPSDWHEGLDDDFEENRMKTDEMFREIDEDFLERRRIEGEVLDGAQKKMRNRHFPQRGREYPIKENNGRFSKFGIQEVEEEDIDEVEEVPEVVEVEENNKETGIPRPGVVPESDMGLEGMKGWFSDYAFESLDILFIPEKKEFEEEKLFVFNSPMFSQSIKDLQAEYKDNEDFVLVDPHILSAPVIVDLYGRGKNCLIVPVSYFFDKDSTVDIGTDAENYIAGGILVFDLNTFDVVWTVHLDLTTYRDSKKAFVYSSPTIIDINTNGKYEILISNSLGLIYAIDRSGVVLPGYPIVMGEGIQGQVISDDIDGDGNVEICAIDMGSHLVCFDYEGLMLWKYKFEGSCDHKPILTDINNDGRLNIIIGTSTGDIYVLHARNGKLLKHWMTYSSIHTPVTIANFNSSSPFLDVLVHGGDGRLHIFNDDCQDVFDVGGKSYSRVLMDDVTGNEKLDIITTNVKGVVRCFETDVPYHPLKTTSTDQHFANGFIYRENWLGIHVLPSSRRTRDVIGQYFTIEIEIVDKRSFPKGYPVNYNVQVVIGRKTEMYSKIFRTAGVHEIEMRTPRTRTKETITVEMTTELGQHFYDSFALSFNLSFLRIIKWTLILPFVLAIGLIVFLKGDFRMKKFSFKELTEISRTPLSESSRKVLLPLDE